MKQYEEAPEEARPTQPFSEPAEERETVTKKESRIAKWILVLVMFLYGTNGTLRAMISLSTGLISLVRGIIATLFLLALSYILKKGPDWKKIKEHFVPLMLSGLIIGVHWLLLLESYKLTTVAISTLLYYVSPAFVVLASAFFLKEQLTLRKVVCVMVALVGMMFVSGVLPGGFSQIHGTKGCLFALGAAVLYAAMVLINASIRDMEGIDKAMVQMFFASMATVPYVLLTEDFSSLSISTKDALMTVAMGIVNTGVAYALYFTAMKKLPAQTVAFLSYLDPITAVMLSVFFLQQPLSIWGWLGAIVILGAMLVSELPAIKKKAPAASTAAAAEAEESESILS